MYSHATLIGTPCVLPLEGPIIWKVPLTEKALFYVINVPTKTSVWPKLGPVIWKVPISTVPITVVRLYLKRIRHSVHLIKYLEAFMLNDGHKAQSNKVQTILTI